jgi:hypothetical protein
MNFPVILLLLLAVAALLRVDVIFYLLYVGLALYGFSYWYTPHSLRHLRVRRVYDAHAFFGEAVQIRVEVENGQWLPVGWMQVEESIAPALMDGERLLGVASVAGRGTAVFRYRIRSLRRGYYQIGPLSLTTGDLFGFVAEQKLAVPTSHLTVYPRIHPLSELGLPSRLPFGTIASHQRLFDDPARPMGVREYQSGDSPRQINWKVTAHTQQLMVKTYQPAISLETAIVLNLHPAGFEAAWRSTVMEWSIELAASLAAHLAEQRQAVGLLTNGQDLWRHDDELSTAQFDVETGRLILPEGVVGETASQILPRHGRGHLMKILERLARVEASPQHPFAPWLPTATANLTWGTTLLIITPQSDPATMRTLHHLVRRGLNPVLLLTVPQSDWGQRQAQARQFGFKAYQVTKPGELVGLGKR